MTAGDCPAGDPGFDTVRFQVPEKAPVRIELQSDLPNVTDALFLDGTTQPLNGAKLPAEPCGDAFDPSSLRVEVFATEMVGGLRINAAGPSTVKGIAWLRDDDFFNGTAITVINSGTHVIQCNHVGMDAAGEKPSKGRWGRGIVSAVFSNGTVIGTNGDGTNDGAEGNVVGNVTIGIDVASTSTVVAGNILGFGADGLRPMGLGSQAISVLGNGADGVRVGTNGDGVSDDVEGNLVGNVFTGVLSGANGIESDLVIAGNRFGWDRHGRPAPIREGIDLLGSAENAVIGYDGTGDPRTEGNLIGNATTFGLSAGFDQPLVIAGNSFDDNEVGLELESVVLTGSTGNCVRGSVTAGALKTGSGTTVFEDNYWGAADGPSGAGPGSGDAVIHEGPGTIDFTPFATTDADCLEPFPAGPDLLKPFDRSFSPKDVRRLKWRKIKGWKLYDVQTSGDPLFASFEEHSDVKGAKSGPFPPSRRYWRVRVATPGDDAPWSEVFSYDITIQQEPADGSIAFLGNVIVLRWKKVKKAESYEVQLASDEDFTMDLETIPTPETTRDVLPTIGTTWWRVRPIIDGTPGPYSPGWTYTGFLPLP
jgi:hypothetical protein